MPLFFLHNDARFSPVFVADTPARQRVNNLSLVHPNSANLPSGALLQGSSDDIATKIHEKRDYPGVLCSQLTPAGEASYVLLFFNSMFRNLMWIAGNCPFWVCLCHWSQLTGSFPKTTKLSHMWQQGSDLMEGLLLVPCMVWQKCSICAFSQKSKVSLFSPPGSIYLVLHNAHTSSGFLDLSHSAFPSTGRTSSTKTGAATSGAGRTYVHFLFRDLAHTSSFVVEQAYKLWGCITLIG